MTEKNGMRAIHPGEILREAFLKNSAQSVAELAKALGVQKDRIFKIVAEDRGITADTAIRLAKYYGTTPSYWLNMQTTYDLRVLEIENSAEYEKIKPLFN